MFKVGQKVVYVSESMQLREWRLVLLSEGISLPILNKVYTVREVTDGAIRLVEIVNPIVNTKNGRAEIWFFSSNFRPLDENSDWIEEVLEKALVEELELVE